MMLKNIDFETLKCRFGCDNPIGIFHIPEGCVCWRDPVQALCMQHFVKAESTGPITIVVDFRLTALADRSARGVPRTGQ
jgi:hypothetical protein